MNERIGWIDSWKGILIFLVVLGHVVGGLAHYTTGNAQSLMVAAYKAIYLFHMPAFFFVVGWMKGLRDTRDTTSWGDFLKNRSKRLLVPYVFWGIVSICIFLMLSPYFSQLQQSTTDGYYHSSMTTRTWWSPFLSLLHAGGWPDGDGFRYNSVLWFLPCMFTTLMARKLVSLLFPSTRRTAPIFNIVLILILFTLGAVLRFYVGALPWGLDRAPRFLAFILMGETLSRFRRLPPPTLLVLTLLFLFLAPFFPDLSLCHVTWKWYWAEIIMAILGSLSTLGLAQAIDCRLLQATGAASLGIMVIHKFPVLALQLTYRRLSDLGAIPLLFFAIFSAAAITELCLLAVRAVNLKHRFRAPQKAPAASGRCPTSSPSD